MYINSKKDKGIEPKIWKLKSEVNSNSFPEESTITTLVIWMKNGGTLYFENVKLMFEDEDIVRFFYHGVSTNTTREAKFILRSIAGYAIGEEQR